MIWCILTTLLLTINYLTNPFKIVEQTKFETFDQFDENMALDRLMLSYNQSITSHSLFSGRFGSEDSSYAPINFRKNYIDPSHQFTCYYSQPGGQMFLNALLTKYLPFDNSLRLLTLNFLCALFTSTLLTLFAFWIIKNVNLYSGISLIVYYFITPVLLLYAKSPWWSIYVFFIPPVIIFRYYEQYLKQNTFKLILTIAALILFKYFINGYEFITSYVFAIVTPIFYFEIRTFQPAKFFKHFSFVSIAIIAAIALSLLLLYLQIGSETNYAFAREHIIFSFAKRSNGLIESQLEAKHLEAINANLFHTIHLYFKKPIFSIYGQSLFFTYYHLLFISTIIGLVMVFTKQKLETQLFLTSIFAFLGALTWFIIFKGHAVIHKHLDQLVLHVIWVPFAIISLTTSFLALRKLLFQQKTY